MCLSTVISTKGRPLIRPRIGYKVFGRGPKFAFYPHRNRFNIPIRRWVTAYGSALEAVDSRLYPAGFHIYTDLPTANDARHFQGEEIYKVEYKGHCTYGTEVGRAVVVAEKMRVLGPCNGEGELL